MDYTTKFTIKESPNIKKVITELPKVPFVIYNDTEGSSYLITKSGKDNYLVSSITYGNSYDYAYTKEKLLKYINDESWRFVSSEIIIKID